MDGVFKQMNGIFRENVKPTNGLYSKTIGLIFRLVFCLLAINFERALFIFYGETFVAVQISLGSWSKCKLSDQVRKIAARFKIQRPVDFMNWELMSKIYMNG